MWLLMSVCELVRAILFVATHFNEYTHNKGTNYNNCENPISKKACGQMIPRLMKDTNLIKWHKIYERCHNILY